MLHIPPYVDKAVINVSKTEPRRIYFALECIEKKSTVEKPSSEKLALSKGCTKQATRNSCFTLNLGGLNWPENVNVRTAKSFQNLIWQIYDICNIKVITS